MHAESLRTVVSSRLMP